MASNIPNGFYALVLSTAFPPEHTYRVALFEEPQEFAIYETNGECSDEGYDAGGKELGGYRVVDSGAFATLVFNTAVDWFDATIRTRCAVVYDADTGVVMNIMNFEKQCGVIGGVFTVNLHAEGVVQLGVKPEEAA